MTVRGPYAKGVAKRAQILDAALEVIDRNGYSGATVKELAGAVGLSQNGLLHYFGSRDALFVEIIRRINEMALASIDPDHTDFSDHLVARILDAADANIAAAGRSQLLLSVATLASEPTHVGHEMMRERYEAFRRLTTNALATLQQNGQFPADGDPDATAALVASAYDGLQLQWLYDQSLDVRGALEYLLRRLGVEG